jgi:hypothetical protein
VKHLKNKVLPNYQIKTLCLSLEDMWDEKIYILLNISYYTGFKANQALIWFNNKNFGAGYVYALIMEK